VLDLVASSAKRQAVVNVESQFRKLLPGFDMMSVQSFSSTAPLASVVVALQDGAPPMFVTPETAIVARRGAFVFPCCQVTASLAAMLDLEMAVSWKEGRSAVLAGERSARAVSLANHLGSTRPRARLAGEDRIPFERRTADNANPVVARFAIRATRVCRRELVSAPVAVSSPRGNGRLVFHAPMIPQNAQIDKLERWATMTGQTPVRVGNRGTVANSGGNGLLAVEGRGDG